MATKKIECSTLALFRYTNDLVFCFPGEYPSTWYSGRTQSGPRLKGTAGVGAPKIAGASGRFWHHYNNRCRFRDKFFKDEPRSRSSKGKQTEFASSATKEASTASSRDPNIRRRLRENRKRAAKLLSEKEHKEAQLSGMN